MAAYKVSKTGVTLPNVDRELFPNPQTAYGAVIEEDENGKSVFVSLAEDRIFPFNKPGKPVKHDVLYTVKAVKPSGAIVQLPMEDQINNQGASPENMIGVAPYVRKDFILLWDQATGKGVFCPTKDCWAKWNDKFAGFCHPQHKAITKPEGDGSFSEGATTSRTWQL